jgi:hypothetical protein
MSATKDLILRNFIFILLLISPGVANSQQPKRDSTKVVRQQQVRAVEIADIADPPPPNLNVTFNNIHDWLSNLVSHNKSKKNIAEYKFGLFESTDNNTLYVVGVNTYFAGRDSAFARIEFKPSNMYFKLPKSEYENLNRDQLIDSLTSQLKDFSKSDEFKNSFFTKSDMVIFETNGEIIWLKK